jgi:hypothetical protein
MNFGLISEFVGHCTAHDYPSQITVTQTSVLIDSVW